MRIFITVKEKKITQMVLLMMENLSLAKNMVKAHTYGLMRQFMLEIGRMTKFAVMEPKNGPMEENIQENGRLTK